MNEFKKISILIFSICVLVTGVLQILDSLFGSGIIMVLAGILILVMTHELLRCKDR